MTLKKTGDVLYVRAGLDPAERKRLSRYKGCTVLSLHEVATDDLEIAHELPRLEHLQLYDTRIADWSSLTRIQTLRRLFVNGVKQLDQLAVVSQLPQIRQLGLANLHTLTKLPDLSACTQLREVRVWNCKRLEDLSALLGAEGLEAVTLVGIPYVPSELERLLARPRLAYLHATFGSKRANDEFSSLLARHGKQRRLAEPA